MRLAPATPLTDLTEKELQQQVVSLFRQLGWRGYHTHDSRRSQPGFPDIVLVRERVIYLELKRETGNLTDKQREWLRALLNAGQGWDETTTEEEMRAMLKRLEES